MDLGSLGSVRAAVRQVVEWDVVVDVVINNAGIMAVPYARTVDGFEMQFRVNHLGHFLFTNLLLREGRIREGGRVVNVSSDGHRLADIRWADVGFEVCFFPSFAPISHLMGFGMTCATRIY